MKELEVTWDRTIKVWWSFVWRNLIATLVAMLIGAIFRGVMGVILGAFGVPIRTIQIIVMPIGFIIGLAISIVPLKLILGKNFGEFRLVLVENNNFSEKDT